MSGASGEAGSAGGSTGKGKGEATRGATDKAGENDGCLGVGAEALPGSAENNWLASCAIRDGSGAPAAWAACVSAPASRTPPPGGEPDSPLTLGEKLGASSSVFIVAVDLDVFENGDGIFRKNRRRAIQGDQV